MGILSGILKKTRPQLEADAWHALQKLKHARSTDNLTHRYLFEDEVNAALDELLERNMYG